MTNFYAWWEHWGSELDQSIPLREFAKKVWDAAQKEEFQKGEWMDGYAAGYREGCRDQAALMAKEPT